MTDQRRKRVVRLLAEDGRLQALLSFSQADLGQLAMAGGILLQSGWQSTRYERKQSEVIDTDENGIPDYGSLVIRLSASSPLMSVLSSSIWSPKSDYLRECLYAIIDKKSAHADAAPHVSARQNKAAPSKPRRTARTRAESRPPVAPPSVATPSAPVAPVPVAPVPPVAAAAPAPRPTSDLDGFAQGFSNTPKEPVETDDAWCATNADVNNRQENVYLAVPNNIERDILQGHDENDGASDQEVRKRKSAILRQRMTGFFDF